MIQMVSAVTKIHSNLMLQIANLSTIGETSKVKRTMRLILKGHKTYQGAVVEEKNQIVKRSTNVNDLPRLKGNYLKLSDSGALLNGD